MHRHLEFSSRGQLTNLALRPALQLPNGSNRTIENVETSYNAREEVNLEVKIHQEYDEEQSFSLPHCQREDWR